MPARRLLFPLLLGLLPAAVVCSLSCEKSSPPSPPPKVVDGPTMVRIPATSSFTYGSRLYGPQGTTAIESFLMAETEITQAFYEQVMNDNPSVGAAAPQSPVQNVSWIEAVRFCNELSERRGFTPCYYAEGKTYRCEPRNSGFRLPTVAEWEYACRGDQTTPFFWGASKEEGEKYCVPPRTKQELPGGTPMNVSFAVAVKTRQPNQFGLYDMAGNVAEWCEDKGQRNGRAIKGGSWESHDWSALESKWRGMIAETDAMPTLGFRVVRRAR